MKSEMTVKIEFIKMHGAGNDYTYVDTVRHPIAAPEKKAIKQSKFHTGIGSDGFILIGSSDKADFSMRISSADGLEVMICGNGSRYVGKYIYEYGLTAKKEITLDAHSGTKVLKLHVEGGKVTAVTIDVDSPLETEAVDFGDQSPFQSTQVSTESPHLVTSVEDITQTSLPEAGPQLENHHLFSDRTNVEFAQIIGKDTTRMRVRERGSGIAQACGTGACTTAVAAILHRLAGRKCDIVMGRGTVIIEWGGATGHILMAGPATKAFGGEAGGQIISIG